MRVALCISGQMRTFREVYQSQLEYVAKPLKADVFVHTWTKTGTTNKLILSLPRGFHLKLPGEYWHDNPDVFSDAVCSFGLRFPNLYQEMQRSLRAQDEVTLEEIHDVYSPQDAVVEDFDASQFNEKLGIEKIRELVPDATMFNAAPMFYKIYACDQLRSMSAAKAGHSYDLVIRLRPDMMFFAPLGTDQLQGSGKLWTLHNPFYEIIGRDDLSNDMMFVGDSSSMSYATSVWQKLAAYWDPSMYPEWEFGTRGPEKILKHHLSRVGLGDDVLKLDPAPQRIVGHQLSYDRTLELLRADLRQSGDLPPFVAQCIGIIQSVHAVDLMHAGKMDEADKLLERQEILDGFVSEEPWAGRAKLASIRREANLPQLLEKTRNAGQDAVFPELFL